MGGSRSKNAPGTSKTNPQRFPGQSAPASLGQVFITTAVLLLAGTLTPSFVAAGDPTHTSGFPSLCNNLDPQQSYISADSGTYEAIFPISTHAGAYCLFIEPGGTKLFDPRTPIISSENAAALQFTKLFLRPGDEINVYTSYLYDEIHLYAQEWKRHMVGPLNSTDLSSSDGKSFDMRLCTSVQSRAECIRIAAQPAYEWENMYWVSPGTTSTSTTGRLLVEFRLATPVLAGPHRTAELNWERPGHSGEGRVSFVLIGCIIFGSMLVFTLCMRVVHRHDRAQARQGGVTPASTAVIPIKRLSQLEISRTTVLHLFAPTNIAEISSCDWQNYDTNCAICIDDMVSADSVDAETLVRLLPCGHMFHKDCIDPWLRKKCTCPTCKSDLLATARVHGYSVFPRLPDNTSSPGRTNDMSAENVAKIKARFNDIQSMLEPYQTDETVEESKQEAGAEQAVTQTVAVPTS